MVNLGCGKLGSGGIFVIHPIFLYFWKIDFLSNIVYGVQRAALRNELCYKSFEQ